LRLRTALFLGMALSLGPTASAQEPEAAAPTAPTAPELGPQQTEPPRRGRGAAWRGGRAADLGASLSADGFVVHFAPDDSLRAELVRAALEAQAPLPALDPALPRDVEVVLTRDEASFRRWSGGRPPEWSAAVALPALNRIVLPAGNTDRGQGTPILQVLRHEWAHLALRQSLPGLRVPRWFDEGYAQWAAGWDRDEVWSLRVQVAMGRTPPLDSLSFRWPGDRASAEAAYRIAATTIEYLVDSSGEEALALFLAQWRDSRRFDEALRTVYGVTSAELEEHWRTWLKKRYGWLSVISQTTVAWLMLGVLLFFTVRSRRRRTVERVAELRARELPDAPAFWDPEAVRDPGVMDPGHQSGLPTPHPHVDTRTGRQQ
jgi:hypothetical protein